MGATYAKIYLHIVFSTKYREPSITLDIRDRFYRFIGGVVRDERGFLDAIGGMPDHLHMLVGWRTSPGVASLLQAVKSRSSGWLHENFADKKNFRWKNGYSVFSVRESQREKVKNYIENQEENRKRRSYQQELEALLIARGLVIQDQDKLPAGSVSGSQG
jgi:REP element-mobilizing transposase RayT